MSRHNNFDCIRLIAALMVIFGHSFALLGLKDPFVGWSSGYDGAGGCGVAIFFVISGYLVSASACQRSTSSFLASRALRIVPALIAVTCFEVLIVGPLFTELPLRGYFLHPMTREHLLNPTVFHLLGALPAVFTKLPVPAVNGSLWTLPVECGLYLLLPLLAFCGGLNRWGSAVIFAASLAGCLALNQFGLDWSQQGPVVVGPVALYPALNRATFFFAGAALWANREVLPLRAPNAAICGLIMFAAAGGVAAPVVYFLCLPYLVIFAAFRTPVVAMEKIGDLSYGTYLLAFPVQQSIISTFGVEHIGPLRVAVLAAAVVLPMAFLSWRFIEAPALRLARKSTSIVPIQAAA